MNAFLLKPGNISELIEPQDGKRFSIQELQTFVGGYVEVIRLCRDHFLIVNEDGLREGFPLNEMATSIARTFALSGVIPSPIVGNVILAHKFAIEDL